MIQCQRIKNKGLPVTQGASLFSEQIRHGKEGNGTTVTEFEGLQTLCVLTLSPGFS